MGDHGRLRAVGLRRRHAAEGLERKHHVRQLVVGVVNVLRDFQVTFTARRARVVVRVRDALQLVLIYQLVSHAAQRFHDLVILAAEDQLGQAQLHDLVAHVEFDLGVLVQTPHRRQDRALFQSLLVLGFLDGLVDQVVDPRPDRLDDQLRALALEERKHVEVAVALGGLRPELTGDLDDGLHPQAVHGDRVEAVAYVVQRLNIAIAIKLFEELTEVIDDPLHGDFVGDLAQLVLHLPRRLLLQHLVHVVHDFIHGGVGRAGLNFERPDGIADLVDAVAHIHAVEHVQEEVGVHAQAGFGAGLVKPSALLEQQHAEAVIAGVAQRQAVLGFVHAEAARATGAGGQEDIVVDNVLPLHARAFERLQVLHQVPDGEIRRIALAVVAILLAELERAHVGRGHHLALVSQAFDGAMHQLLVFPGEAAEQQRGARTLLGCEWTLDGLMETVDFLVDNAGFLLQPGAFFGHALLNQLFHGSDLHQSDLRCRGMRRSTHLISSLVNHAGCG